jgi:hypothetical protein
MDDFKSYYNNQKAEQGNNQKQDNAANSGNNANNAEQTINMAANIAKLFSGKSEGQIYSTILAQAEQGKKDGTLTNADLDNFYSAVSPMLDGFKRKKLAQIIAKLKEI